MVSVTRIAPGAATSVAAGVATDEDGAAILEFALVLPILLALLAGGFELGRALHTHHALSEAVRGGARTLAQVPPTCRPVCSASAAHAIAMTRDEIVRNTGLAPARIQVAPLAEVAPGRVGMRAEVALDVDLLGILGLDRLLTLSATQEEDRIAP